MLAPKSLRTDLVPIDRKGLTDWPLGHHMITGPFAVPSMMQSELQNFLDDPHVPQLFKNVLPTGQIVIDIAERKTEYILSADMPGITKEDIAVSIGKTKAHSLRISASRKFEEQYESSSYIHRERFYGRVVRTVELPSNVDEEKITCMFVNGVLLIEIPKTDHEHGTTIKTIDVQ